MPGQWLILLALIAQGSNLATILALAIAEKHGERRPLGRLSDLPA